MSFINYLIIYEILFRSTNIVGFSLYFFVQLVINEAANKSLMAIFFGLIVLHSVFLYGIIKVIEILKKIQNILKLD